MHSDLPGFPADLAERQSGPLESNHRLSRATTILGSASFPFSMMTWLSSVTVQSRSGTS